MSMTVSRPQGTSLPEHGRNHQQIVKPRNRSGNPAHTGQDAIPRLNENLGIIGVEDRTTREVVVGRGHRDGVDDELGPHVFSHRVAEQLAGAQVQHVTNKYSQPCLVGRQVMSPTILIPGITAVKPRPIRSGAGGAFLSCPGVYGGVRRPDQRSA